MPTIILTEPFEIDFRKLSQNEQKQARKTLRFIADNPKHSSLQIHRLKGTPFWEAYVNMDIRIIFERNSDTLILHAIGATIFCGNNVEIEVNNYVYAEDILLLGNAYKSKKGE